MVRNSLVHDLGVTEDAKQTDSRTVRIGKGPLDLDTIMYLERYRDQLSSVIFISYSHADKTLARALASASQAPQLAKYLPKRVVDES
jgi:hypothetical protein